MLIRFAIGLLLLLVIAHGGSGFSSLPLSEENESFFTQAELEHEVKYSTNLDLLIRTLDGQSFVDRNIIADPETVQSFIDVLQDVPWMRAEVSMSGLPDYKVVTVNTDPTVFYEPAIYDLWIVPSGDQIEITKEGKAQYAKMSKADSVKLLLAILDNISG